MKKVTISVIARTEDEAKSIAYLMESSDISEAGVYCIECGAITDITEEERELVLSQVPDDIAKILKHF